MKRFPTILSVVCIFAAGCCATVAWPSMSPSAARLVKPVMDYVEAPQLAKARLAEIQALQAELASCRERLTADLVRTTRERDHALLQARQAADRYAALCREIRDLDLSGWLVPSPKAK